MAMDSITVRGAREHNLKDIDVSIPRDRLVVVTGLSGSGKSSLVFDTLYAEGQRRYVESLSAYARQFLGQMEKPDADSIEGLSPAISIDQKTTSKNPRSTVGTVTEIYDYMRVLFASVGVPHCPACGDVIESQSAEQIVDSILKLPAGAKAQVLSPVVKDRKGEYKKLFDDLREQGFVRVRVDGELGRVEETWTLERYEKHTIEAVVDRLKIDPEDPGRLTEAVEQALGLSDGFVTILTEDAEHHYSEHFACAECDVSIPELAPKSFSFNSPHGACDACSGLGFSLEIDPELIVVDESKTVRQLPFHHVVRRSHSWLRKELEAHAPGFGLDLGKRWRDLSPAERQFVLYGAPRRQRVKYRMKSGRVWEGYEKFEGVIPRLERIYKETESERVRHRIQTLMAERDCRECGGARLKPEWLAVTVKGKSIDELTGLPVEHCYAWFAELMDKLDDREKHIVKDAVKEIRERLRFMVDVGLDYLTLDRAAMTLSGGEAQRIRLATQIGSGLVGVLYILDEPSIGLHQRDNQRLINSLKGLRDLGNSLLVVEHDEEMIRSADWVLDLGPGAGEHGGLVVAEGAPDDIAANPESVTGRFLSGERAIEVPKERRPGNGKHLTVLGARENNLRDVDVSFPLGTFTCVTGVSGSGKSTLVNEVLYKALARELNGATQQPGAHAGLDGVDNVDKVVIIDQSPIGRTPRSNPATYTGLFTPIRELFAATPEARARGYEKGRFSFNVKGGRCEACSGDGVVQIEMHFLADVYVPCDVCKGARYNRETLQIKYKGKSIRDVLDMTVEDAHDFFQNIASVRRKLKTLLDVGLGYMRLGQPAPTLSGGEAQRVKLAEQLSKRATGNTLYILDEPTTGLHFADIQKLLSVLHRLTEQGNTVLVIEHNLDVVKSADHLIDLGPEGGEKGGEVIAQGTPEEVAAAGTYTGKYLAPLLNRKPPVAADAPAAGGAAE